MRLLLVIVLALMLSGCATGWKGWDILPFGNYAEPPATEDVEEPAAADSTAAEAQGPKYAD